ncbi:MAG: hypothetical protein NC517_12025 [Firmicutes bacterium]|nr:hypothetical protein [Bacillota bacterium]
MADYKHGISTNRDADISADALRAERVQVAIGTAPVNLLDDPSGAVNVPILVNNSAEVKMYLGACGDHRNYTLMQTALASAKTGIAPVVMINVLDPGKPEHIMAVAGEEYELTKGSTTVPVSGILLGSLVVSSGDKQGEADVDYVAAFDESGHVSVAVTESGAFADAAKLTIAYTKLNPEGVSLEDVIGGVTENGIRTGIELVDEIYSRFKLIPEIISAPGFSRYPAVAAALEAKAELAGDLTSAVAVVDVESDTTIRVESVKDAKDKLGCFGRWTVLCWPKVIMAGYEIYASAVVAALLQYITATNGGVPTSPDNKDVLIDGMVTGDGREIHLTKKQVDNYLNAYGVVSFAYLGGWKCWGGNTAAYPDRTEPNNRFIKCVMVGNYLENRFKTEYLPVIGTDGKYKVIDSVVSNFNTDLNALIPDYLAGAEVIFNKSENPMTSITEGHFVFHTRYADWTPVEAIENTFTWDSQILEKAFEGGE